MTESEIAAVATLASTGMHLAAMAAFHVLFRRRRERWALCHAEVFRRAPAEAGPPDVGLVSILKPLCGADEDLAANLDSFAHLRGPRYELLFGVASKLDPAYRVAEALLARHPGVTLAWPRASS